MKQRSEKSIDRWPKRPLARSIPLPYALKPLYDTTRLAILCSKVRKHILATERSEGASYALEPY